MNIAYSKDFLKAVKKLNTAQKAKLKQRIKLLVDDPYHPQLRNHKLSGEWQNYSSINISGGIRAVFQQSQDEIYFIALGTHSQLYK